ncbi:MAG: VWA domain-containing protein [Planctomycetota bacterium]
MPGPLTFAAPWMLWSLLALAPLLAVYFLKVRPRRRPATAYFLWEKVFHERKSNRLWHRLRNLWSLLIMAAAVVAIALALAEPRWADDERQDLLILIDNSASMRARGAGGSRLELAKQKARGLARALDGVQRAAVATVADRLRYQSHLTDNPRELLAAIDQVEPTYERFRVGALPVSHEGGAEQEAAEATGVEPGVADEVGQEDGVEPGGGGETNQAVARRVLLVTDGVLDGKEDQPEGVELILVGAEQTNLGIVAADLQFVPGSADQMSFYYQVASTADEPLEVDLLLSSEEASGTRRIAKVIPLVVEPGVNRPQTLTVEGAGPGRWVAELDGEAMADDALDADDTAWLVARRPPPIPVAVAADDRYFFEQSVRAFSSITGVLQLAGAEETPGGVTLAKGGSSSPRSIIFQPAGESPWWSDGSDGSDGSDAAADSGGDNAPYEVGAVRVVVEDHPVLRHLDPLSIAFVGARRLKAPAGAQVLVEADDGTPLLYVASRADAAAVVVNLDPVASEFYFSAWFPVLVHSAAKHLAGREEPLPAVYRPGDTPRLAGDSPAGAARRLGAPGFSEVEASGGVQVIATSLLSAQETLLATDRDAPDPTALATGGPPGGWFVILAIVAATAESILYHRRKVG